ncbi:MAG: UDP-N-acetylmuramyl peptide synthase, partial [Lawsonibacter sp.]|nr:UDP-N-acetylmuramyl peptide synthase [Lawsonibacter sp.]
MKHTLNDYIALLEERGLLAAPVPDSLDRSAPVELVSYDSREVVPGTLFLCKGAHFKAEFLQMAQEKGAIAYVSEKPYP